MKIKIVVDKDARLQSKRFKNEMIKVFESGDAIVSVAGNSVKVAMEHAEKLEQISRLRLLNFLVELRPPFVSCQKTEERKVNVCFR